MMAKIEGVLGDFEVFIPVEKDGLTSITTSAQLLDATLCLFKSDLDDILITA